MRWPGRSPVSAVLRSGGCTDWSRREDVGAMECPRSVTKADESGALGAAKCRELARWLATPSGRSQSARRAQRTALGRPGELASCRGPRGRAICPWCRRGSCAPEAGRLTLLLAAEWR